LGNEEKNRSLRREERGERKIEVRTNLFLNIQALHCKQYALAYRHTTNIACTLQESMPRTLIQVQGSEKLKLKYFASSTKI
jgi:hypothetical protein